MAETLSGLDRLPDSMRAPIQKFGQRIQELAGTNGLAMTLFGAIATPYFDPAKHSARSVVVLQTVDLNMLRTLAKEGAKLGKARLSAPLIMTPDYITASVDSFPLEFIEIQQCHIGLFGPDYFEGLSFEEGHVRLQCERELKTMLIGMRQGLLAAAGREKLFGGIETDVAERLVRTLRGLLWLHGQREALPAVQVVEGMEESMKRPLSGVRGALNEQGQHGWDEFTTLYDDVDALRTLIDAW